MKKSVIFYLIALFSLCSLVAGEPRTITIFGYKDSRAKPWDPDSIKEGITGSEEAVIYMSQKLAALGYKVLVVAMPPPGSLHSLPTANPRYIDASDDDGAESDIAISWRIATNALTLKKRAKQVYLWPHDQHYYPILQNLIDGFDDVLWLSEWQKKDYSVYNPGFAKFTKIFGNGINPEQFSPVKPRSNPYSCIYSSNYARGLEILLDIWPEIKSRFPLATLDIYYGWQTWGLLSKQKEAFMKAQVDVYDLLDIKEHGLVSHEELNEAYSKASLWTYPCIAAETFCITALRAQMNGCIPVVIKDTGLNETVRHGFSCTDRNLYHRELVKAMLLVQGCTLETREKMRDFILEEYTWEKIAAKWHELFESQKPAEQLAK